MALPVAASAIGSGPKGVRHPAGEPEPAGYIMERTMRLLICGGRDYHDRAAMFRALDRAHAHRPVTAVIAGGAPGADRLAEEWAEARGINLSVFMADWKGLGKAAGPVRNQRMIDKGQPEGVVAFPRANGQIGTGTADMIARARAAGLTVWLPYGPQG